MKFKLNDWVVYPSHGCGQITKAETKEIFGKVQEFFTIELNSGMKIMMPSANTRAVALRKILSKSQIAKVFKEVQGINVIRENNWSKRYRLYMEELRTGEFSNVCAVLKQLNGNKSEFELSFGERKMLDIARELAIDEISLAYNIHKDAALELLSKSI